MTEEVLLFSGGKDSITAGHYRKIKKAVYCNTGVGLNFDYVLEMCNKLGWELKVLYPKATETFEIFVQRFGFPHQGMHNAVMGFLKWHPIRTWANQQDDILLISGRRKKESKRRMKMKSNKEYSEMEGMKFYAPIYNWTTKQVWDYIKEHDLEISPIYKTMHMSGDCFCGAFAQKGEAQLLYTFHKELADKMIELEKKYGGKWGNGTSMKGSSEQSKLTEMICAECFFDSNIETEVPLPLIRTSKENQT